MRFHDTYRRGPLTDVGRNWHGDFSYYSVGVGVSMKAIFTALMVSLGTMVLPVCVGKFRLPAQMVMLGNSTAAISAACHPLITEDETPPETKAPRLEDSEGERRTQKRMRWGVVPGEMSLPLDGDFVDAGHLSFGTEEDGIQEPVDGAWYAG